MKSSYPPSTQQFCGYYHTTEKMGLSRIIPASSLESDSICNLARGFVIFPMPIFPVVTPPFDGPTTNHSSSVPAIHCSPCLSVMASPSAMSRISVRMTKDRRLSADERLQAHPCMNSSGGKNQQAGSCALTAIATVGSSRRAVTERWPSTMP